MSAGALRLPNALSATGAAVREVEHKRRLCRGGWIALATIMALVALDAVAQLPGVVRFVAALTGLGALALGVRNLLATRRARLGLDQLARLVEETAADLDNALINAVQFGQLVDRAGRPLSRELMLTEIARGEAALGQVEPQRVVDPGAGVGDRRLLRSLALMAALTVVCLPRVYLAVLPRYLLPFGDFPPFSFTRFLVEPGNVSVAFGDDLPVRVRTAGQRADNLSLLTSTDGKTWSAAPLFQVRQNEYVQKLESLQSDMRYYVRSETGRSRRYRARVLTAPRLKSARVTYRFPEYAHRKPVSEALGKKGIRGVSGTEVTLRLAANRPLGESRLRLALRGERGARVVPLLPVRPDPNVAEAHFKIRRSGSFAVDLRGDDGLETPEAVSGKVALLRDERPLVYITEPGRPSLATPEVRVPLVIEAEDSFGLRRLQLHRTLNDSQDLPLTKDLPDSAPRQATLEVTLDLADLGVRPGDVITYYATAHDTDPARRNYADSETYPLQIISHEQYEQLLRAQTTAEDLAEKYQSALRELQELEDAQRKLARETQELRQRAARGATPEDREKMKQLAAQQQKLAEQADALKKRLEATAKQKPLFDLEKDLNKKLAELAKRMGPVSEAMAAAGRRLEQAGAGRQPQPALGRAAQSQQEALRGLGQTAPEAEALRRAIAELQKLFPLYEDLAKFLALVEAQGDLVLKAKALESVSRPTPEQKARMEDLAQRQSRIRRALSQVMGDLREHAAQVENDYPEAAGQAKSFADRVEGLPIDEHMVAAEEALDKHRGKPGHEEAQKALDLLRKLTQQCEGAQSAASECFGGFCTGLGMGAGNTLAQLCTKYGLGMGAGAFGAGLAGLGGMGADMLGLNGQAAAGSANLNLYGPQTPKGSRAGPGHRPKNPRKGPGGDDPGDEAPSHIEVVHPADGDAPETDAADHEPYPAKYRALVREYFRRIAEDSGEGR